MSAGATPDEQSALSAKAWADMLCSHFFQREYDGLPVMFFVDDDALAAIHGGGHEEAVASLLQAVRGRLAPNHPRQLFRRIESEGRRWKLAGGEGAPPFLPLLAVAVLAATRMERTRDRAAHNYYKPLRELLGVDISIEDLKASSGDALPYLWQTLQWWLDDKHRGRFGFSTIAGGYFYYSYADSQTLFSSSDRDKLTRFFRWIRLKPGERIDQAELMTYFRIWASRREGLSEGTAYMLQSDEYGAQLAAIIKAAADRWRGVVREDGHTGGDILLTLELFPRRRLALVAERPPDAPAEIACRGPLGQSVHLTSSDDDWYHELPVELDKRILDVGLRLDAGPIKLRLPAYNVHVLEKNTELGRWASVPQLSPNEPAWLLVRRPALDSVSRYLEGAARAGWKIVEREGLAPPGWCLVGEVTIDTASADQAPEGLTRIVPRVQNRFSLKGGLPLRRGSATYLLGGEPDLWLPPPTDETSRQLRLDDRDPIELPASATHVRLAGIDLPEDAHTARMEGISRTFSTMRTVGQVSPSPTAMIGHRLSVEHGRPAAISSGAKRIDDDQLGEARVLGATIEDPDALGGERPRTPLILPRRALRRILLGANPEDITEVPEPGESPWMRRTRLKSQVFEFTPSFEVVWVITEWKLAPRVRVRMKRPLVPGVTEATTSSPDVIAWAREIESAPAPDSPEGAELWAAYVRRARELLPP